MYEELKTKNTTIYLIAFIVGGVQFFYALFFSLHNFDTYHSGLMLKTALDISNGEVLFKETFSQYGFLTPYLQSFFLDFFDKRFVGLQYATAISYGLTAALLILTWGNFVKNNLILLFAGFIIIGISPFASWDLLPWPSVYAMTAQALVLVVGIKAFNTKSRVPSFLLGLTVFLVFGFRWPVGFLSMIGTNLLIICLYFKDRSKQLIGIFKYFNLGFLTPLVIMFLYYFQKEALIEGWKHSIQMPFAYFNFHGGMAFPLKNLIKTFDMGTWVILPLSVIYLFVQFLKKYFSNIKFQDQYGLCFLVIMCLASWSQYHPVPCTRHLYWAASPMIIFPFLNLENCWRSLSTLRSRNGLSKNEFNQKMAYFSLSFFFVIQILNFSNTNFSKMRKKRRMLQKTYLELSSPHMLKGIFVRKETYQKYKNIESRLESIKPNTKMYINNAGYFVFHNQSLHQNIYLSWEYIDDLFPNRLIERSNILNGEKPDIIIDDKRNWDDIKSVNPCYNYIESIEDFLYLIKCEKTK